MRIAVFTLGCKLNQCESEALADAFYQQDFTIVPYREQADLYIVNTCTVTSKAEQKARRMIRKFASLDYGPSVLVTGCYAQMEPDDLKALAGNIHVVPLEKKASILFLAHYMRRKLTLGMQIPEILKEWMMGDHDGADPGKSTIATGQDSFAYKAVTFQYHARAFLKIEDGCDNNCAYCRVTIARGNAVSLDRDEAVRRALQLERDGYREIVLTGVNITAYTSHDERLEGLVKKLLDTLSDTRIRLSSLEPDMVTDDLLELFTDSRIQPHFHLPVQTASDRLIASVNRHYTADDIIRIADRLRQVKDNPFIAADIITGLPGETEEDAEKTYSVLERVKFAHLHIFPFSPRPGTALYKVSGHIPESVRDKRAAELRRLSERLRLDYRSQWAGKTVEVLLEQAKESYWNGLTGNYLHIRVYGVPGKFVDCRGSLCRVVVGATDPGDAYISGEFKAFI